MYIFLKLGLNESFLKKIDPIFVLEYWIEAYFMATEFSCKLCYFFIAPFFGEGFLKCSGNWNEGREKVAELTHIEPRFLQ